MSENVYPIDRRRSRGKPPAGPEADEAGLPAETDEDAESVLVVPSERGPAVDPPDQAAVPLPARVGTGQDRRPIIPPWLRSREDAEAVARWALRHGAYTTTFHATRLPKYVGKVGVYAPAGAVRVTYRLARWAMAEEGNWALRQHAASTNDPTTWLKLNRDRRHESSWRWWVLGAGAVAVVVGTFTLTYSPWWAQLVAVVASAVLLAVAGRPADRPIMDRVTQGPTYRKLTAELVRTSMLATGYGREAADFTFPREIVRAGPGYSALVDLPHGATAGMILDRRDRVAARLRLPLDQVWLRPGSHAGQIELWVADKPISQTRQKPWPLLKAGQADIFKALPLGTDERGTPISVLLMFTNLVIGAIPRMGKTFVLRLVLLAASLDPRVELWTADLKGTGDLSALDPVAHRSIVGDDDPDIDELLGGLQSLVVELRRRAKVIRELPRDVCPENKITPELAANRSLRLHPIVVGIDECQVMFTHDEHGKEFEKHCTDLIKRGPALGIMLLLATQRPDSKSLPTGISGNAGMRFCLRVMGQTENDMVLGTSMYKNGIRATQFTAADKGMGWLVGATDEPAITRTYYVDAPMAEKVVARAVELRAGAGMLPEGTPKLEPAPAYDLLADVLGIWPDGEDKAWSETLLERMADLRPDVYTGWKPDQLTAALKPLGVTVDQVFRRIDGKAVNQRGPKRADVEAAITQRKQKRQPDGPP